MAKIFAESFVHFLLYIVWYTAFVPACMLCEVDHTLDFDHIPISSIHVQCSSNGACGTRLGSCRISDSYV